MSRVQTNVRPMSFNKFTFISIKFEISWFSGSKITLAVGSGF